MNGIGRFFYRNIQIDISLTTQITESNHAWDDLASKPW